MHCSIYATSKSNSVNAPRSAKAEFKTKENAEDYIANMIDWDMLVTIVGQLSEHIAEKKVNEMSINK